MISVVFWLWRPYEGYRSDFNAERVTTAAAMVRRNYSGPLEIVLVTDRPDGEYPGVDRVLALPAEFGDLKSPHDIGGRRVNPSCYRRLCQFGEWGEKNLGERVCSMDLDIVVTADLKPIFERKGDIVLWGDTSPGTHYNGSLILHTPGKHRFLYEEFRKSPERARAWARQLGQWGSDQAWISARLGPSRPKFGKDDGVFSYRMHIERNHGRALPEGARLVIFHGATDPWSYKAQELAWVRNCYR